MFSHQISVVCHKSLLTSVTPNINIMQSFRNLEKKIINHSEKET